MPDRRYGPTYDTPIPASRAAEYQAWLKRQSAQSGRDISRDAEDYDIQGYFLSGEGTDERGHGTDRFKKPNHPTFSDESQYSGVGGNIGGRWVERGGKDYFAATPTNLRYRSAGELGAYFKQYEPNTGLAFSVSPVPPSPSIVLPEDTPPVARIVSHPKSRR
jgi:hypothetical protein